MRTPRGPLKTIGVYRHKRVIKYRNIIINNNISKYNKLHCSSLTRHKYAIVVGIFVNALAGNRFPSTTVRNRIEKQISCRRGRRARVCRGIAGTRPAAVQCERIGRYTLLLLLLLLQQPSGLYMYRLGIQAYAFHWNRLYSS